MVVWKEDEEEEKASHFTPGKDEEEEDLRLCLLGTTVLFLSLRFLYKRKGQTQRDRSTEKDETFGRIRVLTRPITKRKRKKNECDKIKKIRKYSKGTI